MWGGGAGSVLRVRIAAARAGGQRQQAGGTKSHERTSFHRDLLNSGDMFHCTTVQEFSRSS